MTQETLHLYEVTLQDMYALLKRNQDLAEFMADKLADDSSTARDSMIKASYMSECASLTLFNCAGALGIDLAAWALEFKKKYDELKDAPK